MQPSRRNDRRILEIHGALPDDGARWTNESVCADAHRSPGLEPLVGDSLAMTRLRARLPEVAKSDLDVVIRGEPGVGKRLLGRLIHALSPRSSRALVELDARERDRNGRRSHSGTILVWGLMEDDSELQALVAEPPPKRGRARRKEPRNAARLLVTVDVGGHTRSVSPHTSRPSGFVVHVPPLSERREDVEPLARHFIGRLCSMLGRAVPEIEPRVFERLAGHAWPGNARELREALLRVLALTPRARLLERDFAWLESRPEPDTPAAALSPEDLSEWLRTDAPLTARTYQQILNGCDRTLLERALRETDGRIRRAAKALGMARNTLKAKLKRLGLSAEEFSDAS